MSVCVSLCVCFSVCCTCGRSRCSTLTRSSCYEAITSVDIWPNISRSSKNVSSHASLCFHSSLARLHLLIYVVLISQSFAGFFSAQRRLLVLNWACRGLSDRRGSLIISLSQITTWPMGSMLLSEINNIGLHMQWKHSVGVLASIKRYLVNYDRSEVRTLQVGRVWFGLVGNDVCRINEVNQRRARLVLGWVTVFKNG